MELSELVLKQISADRRRGFPVDFDSEVKRVQQIERDLIGLFGEIGEFANTLKKVSLALEHNRYDGPSLSEAGPNLKEELADALIYMMRLSFLLGGNLEKDVIAKMKVNDGRYRPLEG